MKKPISAVQNPVAMCANRITNRTSSAISTPSSPPRQSRSAMNQVARLVRTKMLEKNIIRRRAMRRRSGWSVENRLHAVLAGVTAWRRRCRPGRRQTGATATGARSSGHFSKRSIVSPGRLGDRPEVDGARHHARHGHVGAGLDRSSAAWRARSPAGPAPRPEMRTGTSPVRRSAAAPRGRLTTIRSRGRSCSPSTSPNQVSIMRSASSAASVVGSRPGFSSWRRAARSRMRRMSRLWCRRLWMRCARR